MHPERSWLVDRGLILDRSSGGNNLVRETTEERQKRKNGVVEIIVGVDDAIGACVGPFCR